MSAQEIVTGVTNVQNAKNNQNVVVKEFSKTADKTGNHQLVFFIKPDLTSTPGAKFDTILPAVLDILSKNSVELGGISVLSGDYLQDTNIMTQHYGVIASISQNGESAISAVAKQALSEKFADFPGAEVLGGLQFLKRFPEFNAYSLCVLNDNLGTTRLAGGTYAMKVKVMGKPFIVLNPFSPYQLVPYTSSGHSIVVFEILSKEPWAKLRSSVCGVTDPKDAEEGSIRKTLLNNKGDYGLKEVDKSANGVHMSAGPLEGMVELQRFFKLEASETVFGQALAKAGFTDANIAALAANPTLDVDGKKVSAFDLTEEKDVTEAVELLSKVKSQL